MKCFKITLLVVLLAGCPVHALEFSGNRFYQKSDLDRMIDFGISDSALVTQIESIYRQAGFYEASARMIASAGQSSSTPTPSGADATAKPTRC